MTILIRTLDRVLNLAVGLLCALILAVSVYSLLDNARLYRQADDPSLLNYKPDLSAPMSEGGYERVSEEQVGWISFAGTGIDYPVMQAGDNYAYLNKNPYGEFSLSGAIFLDYRSDGDFLDPYSLIYGHHMEHGKMFGSLDLYLDPDYFDAHRSGTLVTNRAVYRVELFAAVSADGSDRVLFSPQGRSAEEVLAYTAETAVYYEPPAAAGRILALSTCHGDTYTSRLLLLGVLIAE